jgi:hypothetical protein
MEWCLIKLNAGRTLALLVGLNLFKNMKWLHSLYLSTYKVLFSLCWKVAKRTEQQRQATFVFQASLLLIQHMKYTKGEAVDGGWLETINIREQIQNAYIYIYIYIYMFLAHFQVSFLSFFF